MRKRGREGKSTSVWHVNTHVGAPCVIARADAEPEQTLTTLCLSEKVFWNLHNINETKVFLNLKFFI